ncbi:MAG: nitroreductase family protein [Spirochaetales bacterium]|nr:nitroreductase family protein [Spirochaetales bacterium]
MDFEQLIRKRYSVRSYRADPVPEEVLAKVLEAARLAPTAANRQAFRILVIHTSGRENELKRIYGRDWFVQGPLVIGVCALSDGCWVRADGKSYADVDAAIVMDHLILAATDQGLGSCWIGAFDARAAREILKLPESAYPIAFTPLGYPADRPGAKRRRPIKDLVRFESWS